MSLLSDEVFARRRQALIQQLGPDDVVVVAAAPAVRRNRDTEYRYRTHSDFYYLTGFAEPDAVLVLLPGRAAGTSLLFCRPRDREMEIWNGYRWGPEGALAHGFDEARPITDWPAALQELFIGRTRLWASWGAHPTFEQQLAEGLAQLRQRTRQGQPVPSQWQVLDTLLHEMRLIKTPEELDLMQRAADISAEAHRRAMAVARPGLYEYSLEAELLHTFTRHGCAAPAYPSIVGSGANGCILHYHENNAPLKSGDLVLIDAGGELDHYAADITRTFPVNGRFSGPQRALYDIVLAAQLQAIDAVRPGAAWQAPHEAAVAVLVEGLLDEGLLTGTRDGLIESGAYRRFYMHRTGHWLGMDVHDVGDYHVAGAWRPLQAGMVLTVEPGLYVSPDDTTVDAAWRGIGIRIEDDVCVTETGHHVLSAAAPKSVADIEALVGSA